MARFVIVRAEDPAGGWQYREVNMAHIVDLDPYICVDGEREGSWVTVTLSSQEELQVWVGEYEPERGIRDLLDIFWDTVEVTDH